MMKEARMSINKCCLINIVDNIINIDKIKIIILYFFSIFLFSRVLKINRKQKLQCILGSKFIGGLSNL